MTLLLVVAAMPWLLAFVTKVWSGRLDAQFAPRTAVVLLPVFALAVGASAMLATIAVALVLVSTGHLVPILLGVVCFGWVAWRAALTVAHLGRVAISSRRVSRFSSRTAYPGATVVVDDDVPDAFAVPSGGGAVVVTSSLKRALSDDELTAVVAHERAHLRYHHTVWVQTSEIAARLCPALQALVPHVRHAAERHADEVSAKIDRRTTMTAVARVAILCSRAAQPIARTPLAGSGGDAVRRVRALTEPPPSQRTSSIVMGIVVLLALSIVFVGLLDVVQDVVLPEPGEVPTSVFR